MLDPGRPARLASLDGAAYGLKCEYEYSRERGQFLYRFTRNGRFISYETNPHRVLAKMSDYIAKEKGKP